MSEFVEYTEAVWRDLNMRDLGVDEAYIRLMSLYADRSYLYALSDECYTCPYTKKTTLNASSATDQQQLDLGKVIKLNVAHGLNFKWLDHDVGPYARNDAPALCDFRRENMQEFGVYNMTLLANGTCRFLTDKPGVDVNLSLLSVFLLMTLVLSVIKISWCAWSVYRYDEEAAIAAAVGNAAVNATQRKRMRSLDAFRGIAIVLMIFVNSGGGEYWWIEHASWNGLHLADIVFPSFLWIMGVCIPISVKSQLVRGISKMRISLRILWRAIKLFFIGLCLNSINGPQLENLRIMGVLQRFGVAFLVCGILHTLFAQHESVAPQITWKRNLYDLILLKCEFVVVLALIIVHLSIVFGLRVPDCPRGYLGPGGKHAYGAFSNCIGGATGYIDKQILGNSHLYQHPTAKYVYDSKAFDPEGIFGCLLTIVQVMFGVVAGVTLLVHTHWLARIKRWLCWACALCLIAGFLCAFSKEHGAIPINKNLWSLSFVCGTTAIAFAMLCFLYFIIDVRKWWDGFPFVESGMNAIIMYVGHTIMHKMLPWHWKIGAMNTHFVLLLESLWNTLLWIAIALYLDFKEFYYSL